MAELAFDDLPPLQGCLYCHSEGTTTLSKGRKMLGFGSSFPQLKCDRCHSVAWFDYADDDWRINYRHVNRAPRYYYVSIYLGRAGWLSSQEALRISTNGYAQRVRAAQAKSGDLSWLQPAVYDPSFPQMAPNEHVYLTLKAVTLHETSPSAIRFRAESGALLDSGKCYVTDQKMILFGQRRDWFYSLDEVSHTAYDDKYWTVYLDSADPARYFRGANVQDQLDAQLVAAVVEVLSQAAAPSFGGTGV
jgi:hypothetical protein